jgi:AmmeMemoRadiSam system protein B
MARQPTVAGRFYEPTRDGLTRQIEQCFLSAHGPGRLPVDQPISDAQLIALVSPHAGYMCSGYAAAYGFGRLAEGPRPDTAIVLGVNHHGVGAPIAVDTSEPWQTPLGIMEIDGDLARAIAESGAAEADAEAHRGEHSVEVQLPFLQYLWSGVGFVPIVLGLSPSSSSTRERAAQLGRAIAKASAGRRVVLIASTDLSHYEPPDVAERMDKQAIRQMLSLDPDGLLDVVVEQGISMCGAVPTAATLYAAREMGAKTAELLKYDTSGHVLGDKSPVVGYASIAIS